MHARNVLIKWDMYQKFSKVGIPHGDELMGNCWTIQVFIAEEYHTIGRHVDEQ